MMVQHMWIEAETRTEGELVEAVEVHGTGRD
jgi:hypothetical protein